jgi:hypothetical protein
LSHFSREGGHSMIAMGSFFMTMPTQGGRKAIVIFPPGESSLLDITYMLGTSQTSQHDESEQPETIPNGVQQVHRVVRLHDGSCKVVLKPVPRGGFVTK